jgi:hypothetical protein
VRRKTFEIPAGPHARRLLAELLRRFTAAAYPPGGSDCAQVARETLFTTVERIEQYDAPAVISTRQRPLLKQAVQWYFAEISPQDRAAHEQPLLALLAGKAVDDQVFGRSSDNR